MPGYLVRGNTIGDENMKWNWTLECVSIAIVTALILCTQPVAGILRVVTTVSGDTYVDSYTCNAQVSGIVPRYLDVDPGDDVIYYYDISWDDIRNDGAQEAIHNFTMIISYNRTVGDKFAWKEVITDGGDFGSDMSSITVYGILLPAQIWVHWYANITSLTPSCSDSDGSYGVTDFY